MGVAVMLYTKYSSLYLHCFSPLGELLSFDCEKEIG